MKRTLPLLLLALALSIAMTDCRRIDSIEFTPTYAFPLVEANITVGELIGARPSEIASEYAFGPNEGESDSTYFFKLVYPDTLEPVTLLQFQDSIGGFSLPVTLELPERQTFLRMLGNSRDGSFFFSNPEVEFSFNNFTSMEYELSFDTIYTLNTQSQQRYYFNLSDTFIDVAAGDPTTGGITNYTVSNTNTTPTGALTVVFEPTPKYLYYQPILTSKGDAGAVGDRLEIYSRVVLPFEGRGNVFYRDTIPMEVPDNIFENVVDFAFLRMRFTNSIPLQASLTGLIVDTADYSVVGTLPLYEIDDEPTEKTDGIIIPGATQSTLTPTTNPTSDTVELATDVRIYRKNPSTGENDLENLLAGNAIILQVELNTTDYDTDEFVKVFSTQGLKVNLGIKTKINGTLDVDSIRGSLIDSILGR